MYVKLYRLFSKSNYLGRITSHHCPIGHILRDDSSGSNYSTMADPATSGKDDKPCPNPDITGNVKRCLFLSALGSHRDIGPVNVVSSPEEQHILTHHQVVIDRHYPVQRLEVLPRPYMASNCKISSGAEICSLFHIQILAGMLCIFPEQPPAYPTPKPKGKFPKDRHRGLGKEAGE